MFAIAKFESSINFLITPDIHNLEVKFYLNGYDIIQLFVEPYGSVFILCTLRMAFQLRISSTSTTKAITNCFIETIAGVTIGVG